MANASQAHFDALQKDFRERPVAANYRHSILDALGLDQERRLRVVPSDQVWDAHISRCLRNSMAYAVKYMQIIGVGPCPWEELDLRDVECTVPRLLHYLESLLPNGHPLEKNIASELEIHLNDANSQQSTEMLIKAGYLRLLKPNFKRLPSFSDIPHFEVQYFLAINRPWLHLKDDWYAETETFPDIKALFDHLVGAATPYQAMKVLSDHKFSLNESYSWIGPKNSYAHLTTAFTAPYIDPSRNVERLRTFVNLQCTEYYDTHRAYAAPYTSVVQYSGCGKSRLLREYANEVPCVYLCLGHRDSSCFPRPSVWLLDNLVVSVPESFRMYAEKAMILFLMRLLANAFVKAKSVQWDPRLFINCQSVGYETPNQLKKWPAGVEDLSEPAALDTIVGAAPALRGSPVMVLILDEARGLLNDRPGYTSAFRLFTYAWAVVGKQLDKHGIRVFALLTDTTTRVANIPQSTDKYPTFWSLGRCKDLPVPAKLLKPFFMVANMDVFVKPGYPATVAEAFDLRTIARKGRPIWSATIEASSDMSIDDALYLAERKVCAGADICKLRRNKSETLLLTAIASLGMRVVLHVSPYASLAERLASLNMRCITGISDSRDAILTEYPSDPFLSYAASIVTHEYFEFRPAEILRYLLGTLQHKLISDENIGELVQQYIYTLARDSVVFKVRGYPYIDPGESYPTFSVSEFLASLHSGSIDALSGTLQDKAAILQGTMSFSHFIQLEYTPNKRDLLDLFIRGPRVVAKMTRLVST